MLLYPTVVLQRSSRSFGWLVLLEFLLAAGTPAATLMRCMLCRGRAALPDFVQSRGGSFRGPWTTACFQTCASRAIYSCKGALSREPASVGRTLNCLHGRSRLKSPGHGQMASRSNAPRSRQCAPYRYCTGHACKAGRDRDQIAYRVSPKVGTRRRGGDARHAARAKTWAMWEDDWPVRASRSAAILCSGTLDLPEGPWPRKPFQLIKRGGRRRRHVPLEPFLSSPLSARCFFQSFYPVLTPSRVRCRRAASWHLALVTTVPTGCPDIPSSTATWPAQRGPTPGRSRSLPRPLI